jgi:hypothetical protein
MNNRTSIVNSTLLRFQLLILQQFRDQQDILCAVDTDSIVSGNAVLEQV